MRCTKVDAQERRVRFFCDIKRLLVLLRVPMYRGAENAKQAAIAGRDQVLVQIQPTTAVEFS